MNNRIDAARDGAAVVQPDMRDCVRAPCREMHSEAIVVVLSTEWRTRHRPDRRVSPTSLDGIDPRRLEDDSAAGMVLRFAW